MALSNQLRKLIFHARTGFPRAFHCTQESGEPGERGMSMPMSLREWPAILNPTISLEGGTLWGKELSLKMMIKHYKYRCFMHLEGLKP